MSGCWWGEKPWAKRHTYDDCWGGRCNWWPQFLPYSPMNIVAWRFPRCSRVQLIGSFRKRRFWASNGNRKWNIYTPGQWSPRFSNLSSLLVKRWQYKMWQCEHGPLPIAVRSSESRVLCPRGQRWRLDSCSKLIFVVRSSNLIVQFSKIVPRR